MENDSNVDKKTDASSQSNHDQILAKIFETEDKSVSKFFDAVFGFFYRTTPENIFSTSQYYGKQVLLSNYEKWDKKYQESIESPQHSSKRARNEMPTPVGMKKEKENDNCWKAAPNPGGPTHTTNTPTVSKRSQSDKKDTVLTGSKKETSNDKSKISSFDTTNGAVLDRYSWTQTIDDLEVRFPIPNYVDQSNQVKVQITEKHLSVKVMKEANSDEFETLADDPLKKPVRLDGSFWLFTPKQYISVMLEKESDIWWDRLLMSEAPIDLKNINAERDFGSMPEEERVCIERVIADHRREERGDTMGKQKLESVLREAWDAEGSPFKGKPFDPSLVQVMNNSSS